MPFNLLLLPLLGGYMLLSQWYPTRFLLLRSQGHRLLLYSSTAGVLLLFAASVLCTGWHAIHPASYLAVNAFWHSIVPVTHSGKAALALGFGVLGPLVLNIRADRERAVNKAVEHKSDPMELLLHRAFNEEKMVVVSLKSGKVFVGNLIRPPNPALDTVSISLLPQIGGHYDSATAGPVFTRDFRPVYRAVRERIQRAISASWSELGEGVINGKHREEEVTAWLEEHRSQIDGANGPDDFELVILLREIESVRVFDSGSLAEHGDAGSRRPGGGAADFED